MDGINWADKATNKCRGKETKEDRAGAFLYSKEQRDPDKMPSDKMLRYSLATDLTV